MARDDSDGETICICGSETFERVTVERPDGSPYVTAFIACCHCRVMFYRPRTSPLPSVGPPSEREDWADRYRESVRDKKKT